MSYVIRPSGKDFGKMGLFVILNEFHAEEVFTGSHEECNVEMIRLQAMTDISDESDLVRKSIHR